MGIWFQLLGLISQKREKGIYLKLTPLCSWRYCCSFASALPPLQVAQGAWRVPWGKGWHWALHRRSRNQTLTSSTSLFQGWLTYCSCALHESSGQTSQFEIVDSIEGLKRWILYFKNCFKTKKKTWHKLQLSKISTSYQKRFLKMDIACSVILG